MLDYNYAYDLNGNRLSKVNSKHSNIYSYDSMNRVVDSKYDDRRESFTYDSVGNRLTKTTNNITEKYSYNVKNQLQELRTSNSKTLFTYDKQGNTINEEHYSYSFSNSSSNEVNGSHLEVKSGLDVVSSTNTFEYNSLNQQVKAVTKDGNTLVSRYDTEGLRYEIEENEKLSKFIFNKNGDILVESDKEDNVISRLARGYEVVASDVADETSETAGFDGTSRYHYVVDEQGSTVLISDKNQSIKNEYWYDGFGNVLDSTETVHNRITYTGQQFDGVTGQYYLRARYYNPVIGRFTQEDIYRGDGLNLYAYCGNNPVGYYDPSGYACEGKERGYSDFSKYPPRIPEAQVECKKVVDIANSIKSDKNIKNPVISILLHEDRTVSVGISGESETAKTVNFAKTLEAELNKIEPGKYKVSGITDEKLMTIMKETDKGVPGNALGVCAEPKAVSIANKNKSLIVGMDTRHRLVEKYPIKYKNPHQYTGSDKVSFSEMDPCDTCVAYENEYMEYANSYTEINN